MFLRMYAKCIDGQDALGRRLIEDALGTPESPEREKSDETEDDDQANPDPDRNAHREHQCLGICSDFSAHSPRSLRKHVPG